MQKGASRGISYREQTRSGYNRISRFYDLIFGPFEKNPSSAGIRMLQANEGETVLEIGSGTGHSLTALAKEVGIRGTVYGIDISDGMLRAAKNRVRKAGFLESVIPERGDAINLPYKEEFFDAVFMSFTLEMFEDGDVPVLLGECSKVMRREGRICIVSLLEEEKPGFRARLYLWAHNRFPGDAVFRPVAARDALEKAGFTVTRSDEIRIMGLTVGITLARKSGNVPANPEPPAMELQPAA